MSAPKRQTSRPSRPTGKAAGQVVEGGNGHDPNTAQNGKPTINADLSNRLSSLDATFLYFEKKEAPMHIGSVSVFDGVIPFNRFVEGLRGRLPLLPRYRQKVVPAPFNLSHPSWEFDQDFDISNHVFRVKIDKPGSESKLIKLAGEVFTPVMERNKPLWDIHMVYGLEGERTAMIARVHHCMVDGISGVDLLKIVLDTRPDAKPELVPDPEPPPIRDPVRRLFDSMLGGMQEGMNRLMDFQNGLLNLAQAMTEPGRQSVSGLGQLLKTLAAPASVLPFNRSCSGERRFMWSRFPFDEARAVRKALDGTVNDVVLTVLAEAVSRYVKLHGEPVAGRNLRVMVPVSLRREEQRGTLGNLVSLMPLDIPLDLPNPLERFHHINAKTRAMKSTRAAESLNMLTALLGILPATFQAAVGSMATFPLPPVNIIATNVPGPQVPLYAMGHRMIDYYPYVPVGYAVGCGCAIMTYDQKIYFGLTSDVQAMPDVECLKKFLDQSFVDLRKAAGVAGIQPQVMKAAKRVKL
jgi:diacylglycerol O-acyltransferase